MTGDGGHKEGRDQGTGIRKGRSAESEGQWSVIRKGGAEGNGFYSLGWKYGKWGTSSRRERKKLAQDKPKQSAGAVLGKGSNKTP